MVLKIKETQEFYTSKEPIYCCDDIERCVKYGPLQVYLSDNSIKVAMNNSFYSTYINYCPFCGEKLQDEK